MRYFAMLDNPFDAAVSLVSANALRSLDELHVFTLTGVERGLSWQFQDLCISGRFFGLICLLVPLAGVYFISEI